MPPRTIDNLGVDASTRYAEDQKQLDDKFIKESRGVPRAAQIDVTIPSFPSEFDTLFETQKVNASWALFASPFKYAEQKRQLFTHQVIPSLGPDDKREALVERLRARVAKKKAKEKILPTPWEEEREEKEQEGEQAILLKLLEKIASCEKDFVEINGRRGQYHRG